MPPPAIPVTSGGVSHPADLVFHDACGPPSGTGPRPVRASFDTGPGRVRVRTGGRWSPGDGARLLAAIRAARRDRRPLEVVEHGIPISGVLAAAAAESPRLRVRVRSVSGGPGAGAAHGPVDAGSWEHVPDLRWHPLPPGPVVVTGGLGGIGLRLAAEFAVLGHPVALVDRTAEHELGPERRLALERVRSLAPTIVVVADLDRADPADLAGRLPDRPRYLVHAAGELALGRLDRATGTALDRAAAGRGGQLVRLVEVLGRGPLAAVLVLGSSESRASHTGFGAYGLSHACTRAAVRDLASRFPRTRFTVAEWTLWSEVGMAAATAGPGLRAAGFATVSPAWGVRAAVRLLGQPVPEGERGRARVFALGGPRLDARFDAVSVVGGVGGAAMLGPRSPERSLSRLVRGCLPGLREVDLDPPRPRSRTPRALRALVGPRGLRLWSSAVADWRPDGEYEALLPF
ncbi:KR domain-containing protein [Nocardiopsis sp. NPDC006938]|uniref:KR domain-containing protein n=1 Tax=Nocardiopsis sp. NPDC006938 TaxID=3364337 RepID=UPI0036B28259